MKRLALIAVVGLAVSGWAGLAADDFKPEAGFERIDPDSKNLNGWHGNKTGWSFTNGVLHYDSKKAKQKGKGALYCEKTHGNNAIVRLQFRVESGTDAAVLIHGKLLHVRDYQKLGPKDHAAHAKPVGQWNDLEFDISNGVAVVQLNGAIIEKAWQIGKDSTKGVGVEHETGNVEFRHLRMKDKK